MADETGLDVPQEAAEIEKAKSPAKAPFVVPEQKTIDRIKVLQNIVSGNTERRSVIREFDFSEIKRPLTIDDVIDFQHQFRAFDEARMAKGANFIISENQFYEYLSSGSFWGAEKLKGDNLESLSEQGKQGYNDLLLNTYRGWRQNLIKNAAQIAKTRPEVIRQLGDLGQLPNPQTGEELRDLYASNPKLNVLSAAAYQEQIVKGVVNNPFLHFKGHRYSGYEYEQPQTEMRLYLNPPIDEVPKLAREFMSAANERRIPYYFKLIDFSLQQPFPEDLKRVDRMIFYSDKDNAAKIAGVLEELKEKHPEWFADRPLPPMTTKVMDGVGIAAEPSDYQNKKFSDMGKDHTSFNSVRAKFLNRLWLGTVKNVMLHNPDLKPRGGRTLKQIFDDFVPSEDKKTLRGLWANNLTPPPEDTRAKRVLDSALARTMVDVVPNLTPESLQPWLNLGIQNLAEEYGIDPDNLAFNRV